MDDGAEAPPTWDADSVEQLTTDVYRSADTGRLGLLYGALCRTSG